jgi:hypothetical protein
MIRVSYNCFSHFSHLFQVYGHFVLIYYTLYKLLRRNHIKMPINFDINNNNEIRVMCYTFAILGFGLVQFEYMFILDTSQISVFKFQTSNLTSIEAKLYYDIPYEDCHCSVTPTKDCLTHRQLWITYVLPLVLFTLQVHLLRKCLSFNGDHIHYLINAYWFVSVFVFFSILVIIYRSSYYYELTAKILLCTSFLLCSIVARRVMLDT